MANTVEKFVSVNLNFGGNQIKNVQIEQVSSLPTTDIYAGRLVYLTTASGSIPKGLAYHDGSEWKHLSSGTDISTIQSQIDGLTTTVGAHTTSINSITSMLADNGSIGAAVKANTAFRKKNETTTYSNVSEALQDIVPADLNMVYTNKQIILTYSGTQAASINVSDFIKDRFLKNAYLCMYSQNDDTIYVVSGDGLPRKLVDVAGAVVADAAYNQISYEWGSSGIQGYFLVFVFDTGSAVTAEDVSVVDLHSLVDTYTAGNGIEITNNQIAAKLFTASGKNQSGLAVDSAGLRVLTSNAKGLRIDTDGSLKVQPADSSLELTNSGLGVKLANSGAIDIADKDGLKVNVDDTYLEISGNEITFNSTTIDKLNAINPTKFRYKTAEALVSAGTVTIDLSGSDILLSAQTFYEGEEIVSKIASDNGSSRQQITATWNTSSTSLVASNKVQLRVIYVDTITQ